jgi:RNA polymerase sigma-70 factor (ECF subfamily)
MTDSTIRNRFLFLYPQLRARLARRLGSGDRADDALNETFLKVDRIEGDPEIRNPASYLFRMALNAATDQQRAGARLADAAEIDAAMAVADPLADPYRTLEGRAAIALLREAVAALTPRRRRVLEGVRIDGRSCREVAVEMGLSRRTVEVELRTALEQCAESMRRGGYDYAFGRDETSVQ